jgi:hypothetical protein
MAGIMLVALASRVLIAPGFMPASDRPFSIEICWDGLPAALLHQGATHPAAHGALHHHHGSHLPGEHCVFGSACSAGLIPHLSLPGDFRSAPPVPSVALESIALAVRVVHLPQPRAPPGRLT